MQAITSSYISSGSARGLPFSSSCLVSPRPKSIRQSTYLCKAACASFVYISSWNSTLRQQHFPIRRLSAVRQMWASSYSREKSIKSQKHKHTHPHTHIQCRCEKLGQTRWLGFDYVWAKSDGCEANSPPTASDPPFPLSCGHHAQEPRDFSTFAYYIPCVCTECECSLIRFLIHFVIHL